MRTVPVAAGFGLLSALLLIPSPVPAQLIPPAPAVPIESGGTGAPSFATLADLVLAAPLIIDATVRSTTTIRGPEAADVAPGLTRLYVEADVGTLLRGKGGIPPQIGYLVDVAPNADGRLPKLKKSRVLLFARAVDGRPGQIQLVTKSAQLPWTPATDATVRQIATAAIAPDAPPVITGVGKAFNVPGSLPGEGETQIFLTTADSRPVSLSILRRPGEEPRWAVALSEIVDDAAASPRRDTLLWYRLACFLPERLPDSSTDSLEAANAEQARADYQFVRQQLGPCGRPLTPVG